MSLYDAPPMSGYASVCVGSVWVAAPHRLVAQALVAALSRRFADVRALTWEPDDMATAGIDATGDVLVLVDDLDSPSAVASVRTLLAEASSRTLVMTGLSKCPVWGALLVAGATEVIKHPDSVDELVEVIQLVCCGVPVIADEERAALVEAWERHVAEEEKLLERMSSLSPRELTVLRSLATGRRSAEIAGALGVAQSTVRTHIRSIRSKLEVDSQLRAVLVVHRLESRIPPAPGVPSPRRAKD